MPRSFFLSLGSNILPHQNIPRSVMLLKERLHVAAVSSIYETDPVGPAGDQKFWNLALKIETQWDEARLKSFLREIECKLGRKRSPADKFAPRTIDIDLVPQPGYQTQGFIMIPLAEIAPDEIDTESRRTFREIARDLTENGKSFRKMRWEEAGSDCLTGE